MLAMERAGHGVHQHGEGRPAPQATRLPQREEALDPATLTVDDAGVLRAWVRGGRLEARLASSAAAVVGELVTEADGRPRLQLGDQSVSIPTRSAK